MKIEEIRELQTKAFLVLKGLFVASLQPLTVQQIHPMQLACASALHVACTNALQSMPADEGQEFEFEFKLAWCLLARQGKCDEYGGAECRRVYGKWKAAGCPDVEQFILLQANVAAEEGQS